MNWAAELQPAMGLIAIFVVGIWLKRRQQREIERTTRICPTCHGYGRIDREPRP